MDPEVGPWEGGAIRDPMDSNGESGFKGKTLTLNIPGMVGSRKFKFCLPVDLLKGCRKVAE